MKPEDKKIIDMLKADDPEMVKFGATIALGMGIPWLMDNLTLSGDKIQEKEEGAGLWNTLIVRDKLGLLFSHAYMKVVYLNIQREKEMCEKHGIKVIDISSPKPEKKRKNGKPRSK